MQCRWSSVQSKRCNCFLNKHFTPIRIFVGCVYIYVPTYFINKYYYHTTIFGISSLTWSLSDIRTKEIHWSLSWCKTHDLPLYKIRLFSVTPAINQGAYTIRNWPPMKYFKSCNTPTSLWKNKRFASNSRSYYRFVL